MMEGRMLGACLARISAQRIDDRLLLVRLRILELEQPPGAEGAVVVACAGELRDLKDEEEFLAVLAS
jgi:hypothetical protein